MIVITFSVSDKDSRKRFFEKSVVLAEIKPNIVLVILFLHE